MPHVDTVVDGIKYPSVTEVIGILDKPFLYRWYGTHGWEKCEAIKKASQERGLKLHEEIQKVLEFKLNSDTAAPLGFTPAAEVEAIGSWMEFNKFCPHRVEQYVRSDYYKYAGTFDCLGLINDDLVIVDWKFTNYISDNYALQAAAYAHAYQGFPAIDLARVVKPYELKTEAKETKVEKQAEGYKYSFAGSKFYIEERRYENLKYYFDIFLKLREVYDYIHKSGPWDDK